MNFDSLYILDPSFIPQKWNTSPEFLLPQTKVNERREQSFLYLYESIQRHEDEACV